MSTLRVGNAVPILSREKREDALERLLLMACLLLPDDLSELGEDEKLAAQITGEAAWWIDFAPRGVKPAPTDPATRLGAKEVASRRAAYRLEKSGKDWTLVPANTPQPEGKK